MAEEQPKHSSGQGGSTSSLDLEFDEFDLLGQPSEPRSLLQPDLSTTAKAFNTRIQRKKKEQEEAYGQAEKAARYRQLLMINSLLSIRKSLLDVTRIDLGERFKLRLAADDWLGWPRLTLKLQDVEAAGEEYPSFVVTAHDRQATGTVEIIYSEQLPPERLSLTKDSDVKRLPMALKKCVRHYLDAVGELVLKAERQSTTQDEYLEHQDHSKLLEENRAAEAAITGDVFEETFADADILEKLPELESLDELPDPKKP